MMGFFDKVKKAFGSKKEDVESQNNVNDEIIDKHEPIGTIEDNRNFNGDEEFQSNTSEETLVNEEVIDKPQPIDSIENADESLNDNEEIPSNDLEETPADEEIIDKPTPNDKIRNFKYLDDLIHSGAKEIVLDSDVILSDGEESEYEEGIKLDIDDLVVDGNGYFIDARGKTQIFQSIGKNILIKNITLKNGFTEKYGGAIENNGGELTLRKSLLNENSAKFGGGAISCNKGILTIEESLFNENVAEWDGGAIYNHGGELRIVESAFSGNVAEWDGGAVDQETGTLTISQSSFNYNTANGASGGGAIHNNNGFLTVAVSTFNENSAGNDGGAICLRELNKFESYNCNFKDNVPDDVFVVQEFESDEIDDDISDSPSAEEDFVCDEIDKSVETKTFKDLDDLIHSGVEKSSASVELFKDYWGRVKEIILDSDIILDPDEESEYFEGIELDVGNLLIDGNGHTIDARGKTRIFKCKSNVILNNIVFKRGFSKFHHKSSINGGGAIINKGTLSVVNCNFYDNVFRIDENATDDIVDSSEKTDYRNGGGAIINEGRLSLMECNFSDNISINDAGEVIKNGGGAIRNDSSLEVVKSTFLKNTVNGGNGGAIHNSEGSLKMEGSELNGNGSDNYGGAINNESELSLINCKLKSNTAKKGGSVNNMFKGCLRIAKCHFDKNIAYLQGSAIFNNDYMDIKNSKFLDNDSDDSCAVIYHKGEVSCELFIKKCYFSQNLFRNNLIYLEDGFCRIDYSKFDINDDSYIIHNQNANLMFENSKFVNLNKKAIFNNNGFLSIHREEELVNQIKFGENFDCRRLYYFGDGIPEGWLGFAYLNDLIHSGSNRVTLDSDIEMHSSEQNFYEGGIEIDIDNLVIDGNHHTIDANRFSRIFLISAKNVLIKNIKFLRGHYFRSRYDSENDGGGVIYAMPGSSFEIKNCEFIQSSSRKSAGAILNKSKSFKTNKIQFKDNYSADKGGAVLNQNSTVEMTDCEVIKNFSDISGGIYNENSKLYLTNCRFFKNSAKDGGAISNMRKCQLSLKNCDFDSNDALENGGGIYNWMGSVYIEGSNFISNESGRYAGAIDNYLGWISINKSIFEGNSVKESAGAIFNGGMIESLEECVFEDNSCILKGGAIYASKSSGTKISKTKFVSNNAIGDNGLGGAIFNQSYYKGSEDFVMDLMQCDFIANFANDDGAAIFNKGRLNLNECNFKDNFCNKNGETLTNYGKAKMNIANTNFD
ncbi:hypothetical protein [Methanobrevibacter sp.]|uniref:hypothetical protein n=1 Tax=Methanobrevibacter sp. TaxID=66852 RepID=UPI003890F7A8